MNHIINNRPRKPEVLERVLAEQKMKLDTEKKSFFNINRFLSILNRYYNSKNDQTTVKNYQFKLEALNLEECFN